ncbi:MAG TPA: SURF1 family protein [Actinomycetota bacterium]
MRTLLRPRWLLAHLVILALAVTCVSLGFWQLRRLDERRTYNRTLTEHATLPVLPVEQLLADVPPADAAYRRVTARGAFDAANEIILLSRSRNSVAGNHVVTPLVLGDGSAVLVDRGWVPFQHDTPPVAEAAPPDGEVLVRGTLFPSQTRGRFGPQEEPGPLHSVFRIDTGRLAPQMPYPIVPVWLLLEQQQPTQRGGLPLSVELPRPDAGPHLFYAIQWFLFALIGLIGYPLVVRARLRERRPIPDVEPAERDAKVSEPS